MNKQMIYPLGNSIKIRAAVIAALTFLTFQTALLHAQTPANGKPKALIQLSLNENPFGPSPLVAEGIKSEFVNLARYSGDNGEALIEAIAKHEGVDKSQIVTGEILELLGVYLGLKGGPGSEFIYTVPGYPALVNAAAQVGGKVISVPLNEKLENDLPAISSQVNSKTQAVFLVNPHNPSGTVTDSKTFHNFLHQVSKQALVIVDEAYLEFSDDFQGRTAVSNIKNGDNVLVFRTFAKAYGLAGLSFGYAVAPKEIAAYLTKQGLGNPHDLNRLSVAAAAASLKDTGYIAKINKAITVEREKWITFLDENKLKHTTSQANFIYFDIKKPYAQVAAVLKENDIIIGRSFAPYDTWIRISIGLPKENLSVREVIKSLIK